MKEERRDVRERKETKKRWSMKDLRAKDDGEAKGTWAAQENVIWQSGEQKKRSDQWGCWLIWREGRNEN